MLSKFVCVFRRSRKMAQEVATEQAVFFEARRVYGYRAHCELYTDEVHVFVTRRDGKRRDFVASYQAE
jgi:hypothetical protein